MALSLRSLTLSPGSVLTKVSLHESAVRLAALEAGGLLQRQSSCEHQGGWSRRHKFLLCWVILDSALPQPRLSCRPSSLSKTVLTCDSRWRRRRTACPLSWSAPAGAGMRSCSSPSPPARPGTQPLMPSPICRQLAEAGILQMDQTPPHKRMKARPCWAACCIQKMCTSSKSGSKGLSDETRGRYVA